MLITRSMTTKQVLLAASLGHPAAGALNVCNPFEAKLVGSPSVHSALPGLPLSSVFSVTVRWSPAVEVSATLCNQMPIEPSP